MGVGCPWSPRADRDAVRVVLRGHQRGVRKAADADPEVEPSIGDHVDGRGDLREHGRQPNPVVRHQQPEPQPPRLRGQGGEQRPPLVRGPRRIADPPSVVGQQMVVQPCVLDLGDPVRLEPDPPDLVTADIGRRRLDAEARRSPSRHKRLHWSVLLIAPRVIGPRRASLAVRGSCAQPPPVPLRAKACIAPYSRRGSRPSGRRRPPSSWCGWPSTRETRPGSPARAAPPAAHDGVDGPHRRRHVGQHVGPGGESLLGRAKKPAVGYVVAMSEEPKPVLFRWWRAAS